MTSFDLAVPSDFDFRATVWSHGWCLLAPFEWDPARGVLERPLPVPGGRTTRVALRQPGGRGAPVEVGAIAGTGARAGLSGAARESVVTAVRRMLRLDEDLADFHARCGAAGPPFDAAPRAGFGRLLRSPALFEDLVKILATTNTAWSGTQGMVARLVALGDSGGLFPTPAEVAALGAERIRDEARWGYRSQPLASIAEGVADGRIDLAAWEEWPGSSAELEREVRRLPGFGPYATAQALALLGRFDFIGVDSVFRDFVGRRYFAESAKPPADSRMLAVYEDWGEWRALAYWFDVWSDHVDAEVWLPSA